MDKEVLQWAIRNKKVELIVKHKWGFELTQGQIDIVRKIAYMEVKRLSISAMTRYGKTQCVAIGIALLIDFGISAKIAFIGPKQEQAGIIRQYLADLILNDEELLSKAQISVKGSERIGKEASRKRMTFITGAEYRVFSAEGDANRLMGFGADIVIKDEACLISREANPKITRMMGDNPENAILIELYNPWDKDNIAYEHTLNPEFELIQIGWEQALAEGRTTKQFIEQQRLELTPLEFTVLYESKFPDQSDDSLISFQWIKQAEETHFELEKTYQLQRELLKNIDKDKHKMSEGEYAKATKHIKEELAKYRKIVACDPAEKGLDESVVVWGITYENKYEMIGFYSEPKTDPMKLVGKVISIATDYIEPEVKGKIHIDRIGIGSGPLSRLREVISEKNIKHISVQGCHYGESAMKKDVFINKKAENYFRLAAMFREGLIDIPVHKKLRTQLISEKWERTSSDKKKVVDPEDKSPDWGDALVYFIWKDNQELIFY